MSDHLGIALYSDAVQVALLRGGKVIWRESVTRQGTAGDGALLGELLGRVPRRRWPPPRAAIAMGPRQFLMRVLEGLPERASDQQLGAVAAKSPERFFPESGNGAIIAAFRSTGSNRVIGLAADARLVREIVHALELRGIAAQFAISSAVALWSATGRPTTVCDEDGGISCDLSFANGAVVAIRRRRSPDRPTDASESTSSASARAEQAGEFAAAIGAAMMLHGTTASLPSIQISAAVPRWRLHTAAAALLVATLGSFFGPVVSRRLEAARAERGIARGAAASVVEYRRLIIEMNDLGARRKASTELALAPSALSELAFVTQLLPMDMALVQYRRDSSSTTISVVGPRAGALLPQLEASPIVTSTELVGPVTRERSVGVDLERATVKLRLRVMAPTVATGANDARNVAPREATK